MPLLTLDNASLAFGHMSLLDHVAMQVDSGERIALIGRNGTGKSSLLKALAGELALDDGVLWRDVERRIAYVAQEAEFDPQATIFDTVASGLGDVSKLLVRFHEASLRLAREATETNLQQLQDLQVRLESADGWRLNSRVEQVLSKLGLAGEVRIGTLSGGGIKRVALARALVAEPDLLLLDEPTNHLDLDGILWLEDLIAGYNGACVVITHDRAFLDRVASRIIELDRGKLTSFPGNYAAYLQRKEQNLHEESLANARFDKFLAQEEVWIRKGVEARRTRNEGRVLRLEQLRRDRAERRERMGKVKLELDRGESSGKLVAELDAVSKAYDGRPIVSNFSTRIQRGDKIGLIGPNGAGKTTLLKLILGEITPDSGELRLGSRVEVAYFDQFRAQLDPEAMLVDVISPGSDHVEIGGQKKHVISYLGDFLFAPERARSPVRSLSGGERNRLLLARLFARPANVLVLDEPTNDLDIETLELLEELLQSYDGTLFLVSHDRCFLDNVVTQTIVAEGDGHWGEYVGGYEDWLRQRPQLSSPKLDISKETTKPAGDRTGTRAKTKLSWKEQRELEALPEQISLLEAEQTQIQERLADADLYRKEAQQARDLQTRLPQLEAELEALMLRWEELETKAES